MNFVPFGHQKLRNILKTRNEKCLAFDEILNF